MCGRFSFAFDNWFDVIESFQLSDDSIPLQARYNAAPSQMIPSIIGDGVKRRIGLLRWGLIPHFSTEEKTGYKMINARSETLANKRSYKQLVTRKRCIIPVSSFFEWKQEDSKKQPMLIFLKNRSLFALAGLYDTWVSETGERISSCTIITTEPNDLMKSIHNRMPAILTPAEESLWLDRGETDFLKLLSVLNPYPEDEMDAYPVSKFVNFVQNDDPQCLTRMD